MAIEVRVAGQGSVRDDGVVRDPTTVARCDVCGLEAPLVVSVGPTFACKECIRLRLDATSIAAWQLKQPGDDRGGLPWGKISG